VDEGGKQIDGGIQQALGWDEQGAEEGTGDALSHITYLTLLPLQECGDQAKANKAAESKVRHDHDHLHRTWCLRDPASS
jgi:hypothetical protein